MSDEMTQRIIEEARYIVKNGATVRKTAKIFSYSKSTVHKDVSERLFFVDRSLYLSVKKVLKKNLEERHVRGGEATRKKYLDKKLTKL